MSERQLISPLPQRIVSAQRDAADPASSIWVEANAGSGKTRVLTDRVLRLLLGGVPPAQILCLTYTKAAAAEMRQRVSDRLAHWALAEDAALVSALVDLTGHTPGAEALLRARTLFAQALETPGGLRIQTIHAFCESVLHRFPVEAGVPFDFAVIEDFERNAMVLAARESVLAGGLKDAAAMAGPVATLFSQLSDSSIAKAIDTALGDSRKLALILADRDGARLRLRRLLGSAPESSAVIMDEIVGDYPFTPAEHEEFLAAFPPGLGGRSFEDRLARLDTLSAEALIGCYLTGDGGVPKNFPKKAIFETMPGFAPRLAAEAERLAALALRLKRSRLRERSEALIDILGAIADSYAEMKRARSLLDFDDLVTALARLLGNDAQGAWVRYKLDGGISHILVDESQDTNPEQWAVVNAMAAEFFAGEGAVTRPRTLFAVGDGKQSIYSFQGADPGLFIATGHSYQRLADISGQPFSHVRLGTSFRTLPGVLDTVDRVFADDDLRRAVLAETGVSHSTARRDEGGSVTLWPLEQDAEPDAPAAEDWPTAIPPHAQGAARRVAERIAAAIAGWVGQRPLGARGRMVQPADVLVLVQSRSQLFFEIIRALGRRGLPTPGADRLNVTRHIAVLDLCALGDVLLNPADNLQLAALLRSPLFDVDEETLMALAQPRGAQSLWSAMQASSVPSVAAAAAALAHWRNRLDFERPYEFYAHLLGAEGGRERFHRRLAADVDDVLAEFLDLALAHEQTAQPSLLGFLAAMRERDVTIKRELNERGGGVRVMTVHGAKGLEAPIVILADSASRPSGSQTSRPLYLVTEPPHGPTLIHAASKSDHTVETMALREAETARQEAEYWRKLYVGMTRAEDELYVTGMLTPSGKPDGTWYEAIERVLGPATEPADPAPPLRAAPAAGAAPDPSPAPLHLAPVPPLHTVTILQPSLVGTGSTPADLYAGAAELLHDAEAARREGIALHALLQHLPGIAPSVRSAVAHKAAGELLADTVPARRALLAEKVLSILARPELATVFGPASRGEVPFVANGLRDGNPVRLAGRIDRLVVGPREVLVVDFKSDAEPALTAGALKPAYLVQLALYARVATQLFPRHAVRAAILWTGLESLLELPDDALAAATHGFTIG